MGDIGKGVANTLPIHKKKISWKTVMNTERYHFRTNFAKIQTLLKLT
jgi:hypothetical protein